MSVVTCEKDKTYYTDDNPTSDPTIILTACENIQIYCAKDNGSCDVSNCKIEKLRKKLEARIENTQLT